MVLLLLYCFPTFAQDTQVRYMRKSISFVDALLPLGKVEMSLTQKEFLLAEIHREIAMPRFDYNPLPPSLTQGFQDTLREMGGRDLDAVSEAMNRTLVPEILRILDYEKELRASGLVSEVERHSFIVDKAKETGITESDLWAVMNSAYIYLPVLYRAEIEINHRDNSASVDLEGAILWYRVVVTDSGSTVTQLAQKSAKGYAWSRLDGSYGKRGRNLDGARYAFTAAAETFARNLRVATQQIPDFQLSNPLTQTGSGWVEFSLGRVEGVDLDDKFVVAEYDQLADGSLKQHRLGMVRVTRVGKSNDGSSDTRARTIIGSGYQPGMMAIEHPRLPIDISFRLVLLPISVSTGVVNLSQSGSTSDYDLYFDQSVENRIYAGQLWFNYNLAQTTHLPQFFVSIYGELGGGQLTGGQAFGASLPAGVYWGLGGGLAKKFYLNRLHLGLEATLSYAQYQIEGQSEFGGGMVDWKWRIDNLGATLNGNLEIALGYDLNLGGGVCYRAFADTDGWEDPRRATQPAGGQNPNGLPKLTFSGWGTQVYLTWSLPTLAADPIKIARGIFGR
jgi:hypothetical protein